MSLDRFQQALKVREGESPRDRWKRQEAERIIATMDAARESYKRHLQDIYQSNSEVQQMNAESQDERIIRAKSNLIRCRKEYNDFKYATDTTLAQAEREVNELIRKVHRERGWE